MHNTAIQKGDPLGRPYIMNIVKKILFSLMICSVVHAEEELSIPGNSRNGWSLFFNKNCIKCHSIFGEGGKFATDLGRAKWKKESDIHLAVTMWNHLPEMRGQMARLGILFTAFSYDDMADIFAFLYFIRNLDEPGDRLKGETLLKTKNCDKCHSLTTKGAHIGPDLAKWGAYVNPVVWAQIMWQHAPEIEKQIKKMHLPWPELQSEDLVNIIAYINSISNSEEKIYLTPGNSKEGQKLFIAKRCNDCHAIDYNKKGKIKFDQKSRPKTFGEFAVRMWNHSPEMNKAYRSKQISRPSLTSQEMADIISYYFARRYFEKPGNSANGKKLFASKNCVKCHTRGESNDVMDLNRLRGKLEPITLATKIWGSGFKMFESMRSIQITWPIINEEEMRELLQYLNGP
jgi:cytochrome c2